MCVMLAQSTPTSYHTNCLVKTEEMSAVSPLTTLYNPFTLLPKAKVRKIKKTFLWAVKKREKACAYLSLSGARGTGCKKV